MKKKLPKSIRRYIRLEKARIRREILDIEKQKQEIKKLIQKFRKPKEDQILGINQIKQTVQDTQK